VDPTGPAADALEPGAVILEVNHKAVQGARDAAAMIKAVPSGEPALLTIKREGHTRFVAIARP
jgi:S1-C subfamily serine protease